MILEAQDSSYCSSFLSIRQINYNELSVCNLSELKRIVFVAEDDAFHCEILQKSHMNVLNLMYK